MSYDLIIIGAGPAGLYAAYLAGLRQLKTLVLEALPNVGGQLSAFYPDKPIYDIPGFAGIEAQTFIDQLLHQYQRFEKDIPILVSSHVQSIEMKEEGFHVITPSTSYETRFVLFTTGAGSLTPRKFSFLPNHPRVHYQLTNKEQYQNQRLLVLGGGDSALDIASQLQTISPHVTLMHRRREFRGLEITQSTLTDHVTIKIPYLIETVQAKANSIEIQSVHHETQQKETASYAHVFVAYGFEADTQQWKDVPFERIQQKLVVTTSMETTIKGMYAAGHAVMYPGKTNTIATALGEVNTAVDAITHALRPGKAIPFSSFLGLK
jgi:thioredoxin reductase